MKQQFAAKHPWTILAAGAAIQVLTGLPAAWGVFQQPVMEEYGLSEQGAGYAFALLIAAFGVGCVLGGFLQDKMGPRCAAVWGTALLCGGFVAAALVRFQGQSYDACVRYCLWVILIFEVGHDSDSPVKKVHPSFSCGGRASVQRG